MERSLILCPSRFPAISSCMCRMSPAWSWQETSNYSQAFAVLPWMPYTRMESLFYEDLLSRRGIMPIYSSILCMISSCRIKCGTWDLEPISQLWCPPSYKYWGRLADGVHCCVARPWCSVILVREQEQTWKGLYHFAVPSQADSIAHTSSPGFINRTARKCLP